MYNKLTLDKVNLTFYTVCRWLNINNKHEACSSATTVYGCYQSVKDSYFLRAATVIVAENNTNIASHNKHRTITIHLRNCSKLINSFVLCNSTYNFVGSSNTCSCFRGNVIAICHRFRTVSQKYHQQSIQKYCLFPAETIKQGKV